MHLLKHFLRWCPKDVLSKSKERWTLEALTIRFSSYPSLRRRISIAGMSDEDIPAADSQSAMHDEDLVSSEERQSNLNLIEKSTLKIWNKRRTFCEDCLHWRSDWASFFNSLVACCLKLLPPTRPLFRPAFLGLMLLSYKSSHTLWHWLYPVTTVVATSTTFKRFFLQTLPSNEIIFSLLSKMSHNFSAECAIIFSYWILDDLDISVEWADSWGMRLSAEKNEHLYIGKVAGQCVIIGCPYSRGQTVQSPGIGLEN